MASMHVTGTPYGVGLSPVRLLEGLPPGVFGLSTSLGMSGAGLHPWCFSGLVVKAANAVTPKAHAPRLCSARQTPVYAPQNYYRSPTCLFGGKGGSMKDSEDSPWKSLEKAMGNIKKERSLQDILREQIQEQEFDGGGGSGSIRGGGGGGGGGPGDSEGESSDGILDEFIQVISATTALVFMYIYMIEGEELFRLAKDYLKYLFGSDATIRLKRAMNIWVRLFRTLTRKKKTVSKQTLEQSLADLILITPTWWHNPKKLSRISKRMAHGTRSLETREPDDDPEFAV